MTDRSSTPEQTPGLAALGASTHRVEAVNAVTPPPEDDETGDPEASGVAPTRTRTRFDFQLTALSDPAAAAATVLELFTSYLVAASHAHCKSVGERLAITRIVVDGTVSSDADASHTSQSAVSSVDATIHVKTAATDSALERWRRLLRDAEATQDAVPTDVSVSLAVVRSAPSAAP